MNQIKERLIADDPSLATYPLAQQRPSGGVQKL